MFLEKRVYQGSAGRVYPLPFTDRIAEKVTPRSWAGIWLENEFVRVLLLPELGGRIHRVQDKTNGYDVVYYQPTIKPALVGLAGPWCSGGIELNWPQHHRPSTFMPANVAMEHHDNGAVTVWMSEHDPMARMKGMHGVCLQPDRSWVELKVRAYNRTSDVQTFLWWANVATRVHELYQSFFPTDAFYVADHAKRAMSRYPLCRDQYYGIDYGVRARKGVPNEARPRQFCLSPAELRRRGVECAPNDLSWYANIPVPTSYMCMGSSEDFFGGYDHAADAGIMHVANHHIAPGKKQWTWGNHEFGYAWDRNLTEPDSSGVYAPYIEIMAGVYTDNQPDFSFLQPGETKTWSQYWYPIQKIGTAQKANLDAAVSLQIAGKQVRIGVAVTSRHARSTVTLSCEGRVLARWRQTLAPDQPLVAQAKAPLRTQETQLVLEVCDASGRELIRYVPRPSVAGNVPPAATEPPAPEATASADELFFIGAHLEQYRHATRCPTLYWREALRRDSGDARCNLAMGRWHLRRGEFPQAEAHLRASLSRQTSRNPNPYDGEAGYQLGICLRHVGRDDEAYAALYKATWNQAWQAAGYHALAEIDCRRGDWLKARDHLERALRMNTDNLRARDLKVLVLRRLGRAAEAADLIAETLALDPLDWWARDLRGEDLACDNQVRLDLALDYARAGFSSEALHVLAQAKPEPFSGAAPLVEYYRAWLSHRLGDARRVTRHLAAARAASPDYCFPARLEEIAILEFAMAKNARDARAPFYLGNLFYDRRRHHEAIALWERSARLEPSYPIVWRNLGMGYWNILGLPKRARVAYDRAFRAEPDNARLFYERDQLRKRLGESPAIRLRDLERHRALVATRDDLTIEFCSLLNQTGRHADALALLRDRRFQPWEGGEGMALGQHVRTHLALGRAALAAGAATDARAEFEAALGAPENLGEAKHLLSNQSDIHFWVGCAYQASGDLKGARQHWSRAAKARGDFQEMSVRSFSELTYWSGRALEKLGDEVAARRLFKALLAYAQKLKTASARLDYFATSLPTMLLFEDDLQARQTVSALLLEAQARLGLRQKAVARRLLHAVLKRDPNHAAATDLLAELTA